VLATIRDARTTEHCLLSRVLIQYLNASVRPEAEQLKRALNHEHGTGRGSDFDP